MTSSRAAARYPAAPRLDITENLLGHQVADPYRWLEDAASEQTRTWLAAQDELYADVLATLPGQDRLAGRLTELLSAGLVSPPVWRGGRQFYLRREARQEHAVLYTAASGESGEQGQASEPGQAREPGQPGGAGEAERVLIDPMAVDPSGTTTLDAWQPDHEGRLLAYQLSEGGREESVLRVMDVATGQDVDGPIDRCRYTGVAWLPGGKAFYYVRRLAPDQVPAGEDQFHRRVYLHRVGTPPEDDVLIHGEGREKTNYYGVLVSRDGRWLVIDASAGTAPRNDVWVADLTASPESAPDLQVLQEGVDALASVRAGRDGRLYVHTDRDAPRGRLAVADQAHPDFPGAASWRDILPEDPGAVLSEYTILDGAELDRPALVASWTRHAISEITVHDRDTGERTAQLSLAGPGAAGGQRRLGSAGGLRSRPEGGHEAWLSFTDYATPPVVLHYDARSGTVTTWARSPGSVEVPQVRAEQVAFPSADGTTIRMIVISGPASAGSDGQRVARPAILYGYGGFNVSLSPAYSAQALAWVEAGGVYAVANLRGGSEEGEDWHRAGMRERKQNVFDDFAAAARQLAADGWTTPGQLAISGGSNGGLLVGASLTQHPELFAAVICSAPLLDMIRYEQFGLGVTWNDEYGRADNPEELGWLLGYSPYHHVRAGTAYPAVLFTIFDGDTRVDPLHARKMCAALQHATTAPPGTAPVLLRREKDVGHGARAVSRTVALASEQLAFAAAHTGLAL
ncbi:MAG TPA: prolyl oligopeptidase family serine peptidase [Streptosporangiaceae bacterium]|nr:prolyl oligopeptidase family serine peptidase [Streptosporangiaceae bacterium]